MYLYNQLQMTIFIYCITNAPIPFIDMLEKPRDFDPFGQTGFAHLWLQYD